MKTVLGKKIGLNVTSIFINCIAEGLELTDQIKALEKLIF